MLRYMRVGRWTRSGEQTRTEGFLWMALAIWTLRRARLRQRQIGQAERLARASLTAQAAQALDTSSLVSFGSVAGIAGHARFPFGFGQRVLDLPVLGSLDGFASFVRGGAHQCQAAFLHDT